MMDTKWREVLVWSLVLALSLVFLSGWSVAAEGGDGATIERLDPNMAAKDPAGEWLWYDARNLELEGKAWNDTESYYDRLPARAKGVVRDPVWSLSKDSAGMAVRFTSDAGKLAARWTVTSDSLAMPHMPATGVSGLDLYVNDAGTWRWIGNGRPKEKTTEAVLADGIPAGFHEYLVYLPLYNGTDSLEIGVPPSAVISRAPARPADKAKPIVFYGTSIVQGGCASRPGMVYPAIIGRRIGRPVVNLGFSGNGRLDPEVGALLAEIDAAVYVLDCAPNLSPEDLRERTEPFVRALRAARPNTPIVLVENIAYQHGAYIPSARESYEKKNVEVRAARDHLLAAGMQKLSYVGCEALLGADGEATVDGTHATDLGFLRMADAIQPAITETLSGEAR